MRSTCQANIIFKTRTNSSTLHPLPKSSAFVLFGAFPLLSYAIFGSAGWQDDHLFIASCIMSAVMFFLLGALKTKFTTQHVSLRRERGATQSARLPLLRSFAFRCSGFLCLSLFCFGKQVEFYFCSAWLSAWLCCFGFISAPRLTPHLSRAILPTRVDSGFRVALRSCSWACSSRSSRTASALASRAPWSLERAERAERQMGPCRSTGDDVDTSYTTLYYIDSATPSQFHSAGDLAIAALVWATLLL